MIDSDSKICLTVASLIKIEIIITGSNNITLRKVILKQCGFDKIYMDIDLRADKLYQIIDQFSKSKSI